jgi:hypothetical protein
MDFSMAEYALYLDDGGHPDDQPTVVVAGYVASEKQWLDFEPQWLRTLDRFGLGAIFHMTDFMHDRSYSTLKRDQVLSSLAGVTNRYAIRPFVEAIDMRAYKTVNDEFALEECHGAPYALVARGIARSFHIWESENLHAADSVIVFVEQGTKHYGDLEQVFQRDGMPPPVRVPKSTPQVQPSDILAWETFNQVKRGNGEVQFSKNLDRLTRAIRKKENLGGMFYEADLRRLCADTNTYPRATISANDSIAFHTNTKRKRKRTIY